MVKAHRWGGRMSDLPAPEALFLRFLYDSGDEGSARTRFQRLVTDLIGATLPQVGEVAGPGGYDWGIDTYVGQLDQSVAIWQSKFFLAWSGETQRGQVRSSFKEAVKRAKDEGYEVTSWTLCVPCILPPEEQKWFDGWRSRQTKTTGIAIQIWNGGELRRRLHLADCVTIRELYFREAIPGTPPLEVAQLEDPSTLDRTLFVQQLRAAGHIETDAAKGFYFAAEALSRDIHSRKVPGEISALREIELEAQGTWEDRFNLAVEGADETGRMKGLVIGVTDAVSRLANPVVLPLQPSHKRGVMHRLVELARAGWVVDWRRIAADYSPSATDQPLSEDAAVMEKGRDDQ